MLSTIAIYNAGAEDPVITHDDALDVVRPKSRPAPAASKAVN